MYNMEKLLTNLKKKIKSSLLLTKIMWTLLIILVYMLGRLIPIASVSLGNSVFDNVESRALLNQLALVTGGQYNSMTLFSLGLGPWMTSMILWRFVTIFGMFKKNTSVKLHYYRMLLTLAVAVLQSYGICATSDFSGVTFWGVTNIGVLRLITMLTLISGTFILVWLGDRNSQKGIGGMTVLILINMIVSFISSISTFFSENNFDLIAFGAQVVIMVCAAVLLVWIAVVTYRAEYRIPIQRVSINSTYAKESYLPIRLTPAGGMPFMYSMTLMMLPPVIINVLLTFYPNNSHLLYLSQNIALTTLPGVLIYIFILYLLSIGFAYYNCDAFEIAKNLRNNGDYIEHVIPGKETQKFLQRKIWVFANVGALFMILLGGAPLLLSFGDSSAVNMALSISNGYIIVSLIMGIIEQVQTLQMWKQYKDII